MIRDANGEPLYWQEYAPHCFGLGVDWKKVKAYMVIEDEWNQCLKDWGQPVYYRIIKKAKPLSFYWFGWMVHVDRFINRIRYRLFYA